MTEQLIAKYINKKRNDAGLTYRDIADQKKMSESTVKNLCAGITDNPGIKTIIPVMEAVDGSFDEMLFPEKYKERVSNESITALMSAIRETNGEHVHDIRTHYEQHRDDMKENYEHRLADKRELIDSYKEHIKTLEKDCRHSKIAVWICVVVFIAVLIAEVANPNLGWLRY